MFVIAWGACWAVLFAANPPANLPQGRLAPSPPADLAPLLAPICERRSVPGIVGAVLQGRRLVAVGAAGVRSVGSPEKVAINDRFHIGSCTKAMTATLAAMLVENGKITWTSTLADVFPEIVDQMQPPQRRVTLEQLLLHRSGFLRDVKYGNSDRRWPESGAELMRERRDVLSRMLAEPFRNESAGMFAYSNAGYVAAGAMLERAAGACWESLLTERLFKLLGMTTAGFGAPGKAGVVDQPRGHGADGKPVEPGPGADNPETLGPAGRVHCSIGDWAKFAALHLRGAQGDARLLKPQSFTKLHAALPGDADDMQVCMGWLDTQRRWGGGRVLTHTGSNTRWFAVVWLAPKRDFAVLAACNRGDNRGSLACDDACWRLINYYLMLQSAGAAP